MASSSVVAGYSSVSQRLMAQMGWKEGESLGKNSDGVSTYVKVQKRGEGVGLGSDRRDSALAPKAKGSGKASFDDGTSESWWNDAFGAALARANGNEGGEKTTAAETLERTFAATGSRLGMRARMHQGAKLRRTEGTQSKAEAIEKKRKKESSSASEDALPKKKKRKVITTSEEEADALDLKKKKKKKKLADETKETRTSDEDDSGSAADLKKKKKKKKDNKMTA